MISVSELITNVSDFSMQKTCESLEFLGNFKIV